MNTLVSSPSQATTSQKNHWGTAQSLVAANNLTLTCSHIPFSEAQSNPAKQIATL